MLSDACRILVLIHDPTPEQKVIDEQRHEHDWIPWCIKRRVSETKPMSNSASSFNVMMRSGSDRPPAVEPPDEDCVHFVAADGGSPPEDQMAHFVTNRCYTP